MLKNPNASIIGLIVPGFRGPEGTEMRRKKSTPAFPPVDLTTTDLDPRVTYDSLCDHMYWAKDGTLKMASGKEWPLEYRNGTAVGRHEPEPEATNYQLHSQTDSVIWADYVTSINTTSSQVAGPNGENVTLFGSDRLKVALYDNSAAAWLVREFIPPATTEFSRVIMSGTLATDSTIRTYIARRDATGYCYALSKQMPHGIVTASFYRALAPGGIAVGLVQVEPGDIATSPIITTNTVATRYAPTIRVNQPGAKHAFAHFDNGNVTQLLNIGNDSFQLRSSTVNWGERYITRIEFE